ncbi:MAG: hypothetical protein KTR28_00080 [Micavibrio sp.]|nr:hypothetical protein [Micavibrio sp.]
MADVNTADLKELNQTLSSIGLGGNDDTLNSRTLVFLNQLNQLFGDDNSRKIDLKNFTPEMNEQLPSVIDAISKGIDSTLKTKNEDGRTPLQQLDAIVKKDIDFLVEPYSDVGIGKLTQREIARGRVEDIYNKHTHNGQLDTGAVVLELLDLSNNKTLAQNLTRNSPQLLDHMAESVALLNNATPVLEELKNAQKSGLFVTQAVDNTVIQNADPATQLTNDMQIVKGVIGLQNADEEWSADAQGKLKAFVERLQNDPYFGREVTKDEITTLGKTPDIKPGLVNADFIALMSLRADAMGTSTLTPQFKKAAPSSPLDDAELPPQSNIFKKPEDAQSFFDALANLQNRRIELVSTADKMDLKSAALNITTAMALLNPEINAMREQTLAEAGKKLSPELVHMFAGDIATLQLEENIEPHDQFLMRDQVALQGLMTILSHRQVLNLGELKTKDADGNVVSEDSPDWQYTPLKGQEILQKLRNKENPPSFLKNIKDEDKRKQIEHLIKSNQLDDFIASLDHMHYQGVLKNFQLDRGQGLSFGDRTQQLLVNEINRLRSVPDEGNNAVMLFDTLVLTYNNDYHINDMLDADRQQSIMSDPQKNFDKKFEDYYKGAHDAFMNANPDASEEDFEAYLLPMITKMGALPFGTREEREQMKTSLREAIVDADGDSAKFSAAAMAAMKALNTEEKLIRRSNPDVIEIDPKLADGGFIDPAALKFGEKQFTMEDIFKVRDDYEVGRTPRGWQETGLPPGFKNRETMMFKDNEGQVYIAGVDRKSQLATIEKVDYENYARYADPQKYMDEHSATMDDLQKAEQQRIIDTHDEYLNGRGKAAYLDHFVHREMIENDPGYALLANSMGRRSILGIYGERINPDNAPSLNTVAKVSAENADVMKSRITMKSDKITITEIERENARIEAEAEATNEEPTLTKAEARRLESLQSDVVNPIGDEVSKILEIAFRSKRQMVFLDEEQLRMVKEHNRDARFGKELPIGKGLNSQTHIQHINLEENPNNLPLIAYTVGKPDPYKKDDAELVTIEVEPADPRIFDPAELQKMKFRGAGNPDEGHLDYYKRLTHYYPQMARVIESAWNRSNDGFKLVSLDDPSAEHQLQSFTAKSDLVLNNVENYVKNANNRPSHDSLRNAFENSYGEKQSDAEPESDKSALSGAFTNKADGTKDTPEALKSPEAPALKDPKPSSGPFAGG